MYFLLKRSNVDILDNEQIAPELLQWCTLNEVSIVHYDESGTIIHTEGATEMFCTSQSSIISPNVDNFYFECELTQCNKYVGAMIGFTTSGLTGKNPIYDLHTFGLSLYENKVSTLQYGRLEILENIDQIKNGDIIGMALNGVMIDGKKYSIFQLCLNGIKIGHPLLSYTFIQSAFATISTSEPGYIIKANLGSKPFLYDNILGKFEFQHFLN